MNVPNDIIKEITEVFDPARFADRYTLQQLRLVNRVFNSFATSVLLKNINSLRLGTSHESMLSRTFVLASSPSDLRRRLKNLEVSRYVLVPRGWMTAESSKAEADDFTVILNSVSDTFTSQLRKVLLAFAPGFRFEKLQVGLEEDELLNMRYLKNVIDAFMPLLSGLVSHEAFSEVRFFGGIFFHGDLQRFLLGSKDIEHPSPTLSEANTEVIRFLRGIESLDLKFVPSHGKKGSTDSFIIGHMVRLSESVRSLSIRHAGAKFRTLFNVNVDEGRRITPVASLRELSLAMCTIDHPLHLEVTLSHLPNLTTLRLVRIDLREEHRWGAIFDNIRNSLKNIVSLLLEILIYYDDNYDHEALAFYHAGTATTYRRPIFTSHETDVIAMKNLIDTVRKRRREQGLVRDIWLSEFCQQRDILRVMPTSDEESLGFGSGDSDIEFTDTTTESGSSDTYAEYDMDVDGI